MGPWHKVLSAGPAGGQRVPSACLSTDQYHEAGRGAGAVMGGKTTKPWSCAAPATSGSRAWSLERIAEAQTELLEKRHVGSLVLVPSAA